MGLFANPTPSSFVRSLPKAELHLHLEGAIDPATLLEVQHNHGLREATLADVEKLYQYSDFSGFMVSFKDITAHLQVPDDYELITYRLMERLKADNVLHAEVYVSGETTGPESIWGALNLRAERIGHALTAQQDSDLLQELSQRQVPVEICVTSNVRTGVCANLGDHPVRRYFDQGLMVTINTDDPSMFGTTLSAEYQVLQENFGFTDEHLRELARNSFEAAFLPVEKKLEFLNLFDAAAATAR